MAVTVSYPGLYLQELPSNARSIVAAPTSIAVFVGYVHPYKTGASTFGKAMRIASFTDYERHFGGLFLSSAIDCHVGHAVNQFFLNGGSDAYVVGLMPKYQLQGGGSQTISPATQTLPTTGGGIVFTALEPTDSLETKLTIKINNIPTSLDRADFTITYGTRVETFRAKAFSKAGFDSITAQSSLVSLSPKAGNYGTAFASATIADVVLADALPANLVGTFSAQDFAGVFQTDQSLDKVESFNLLLVPGVSDNNVLSTALAFAEKKQAFLIMDPPANCEADANPTVSANDMNAVFESGVIPFSQNGALYFPYLKSTNPVDGKAINLPPSGFVAGIFARIDTNRGVWKAPAGMEAIVRNTTGVVDTGTMNDPRQGVLNLTGINCLRTFAGVGTVVFGSRTLVSANTAYQDNKYVPVRRMTLFIEQSLLQSLKWIVFEPNDTPLWLAIRTTIEDFMLSLFKQGALQGDTPSKAFQVVCDKTTTTPADQQNGIVNIVVGFAPLKPAEFVIIKIAHLAGQTQS